MKYLIFDSGPLINFSMNGILYLFRDLKKIFPGKFLITKEVKKEIIDYPETIKRFELAALQLNELIKEGVIELLELNENQAKDLEKVKNNLKNTANNCFKTKNQFIHLIDEGELASLALSKFIKESNLIVVDERTTRMLCESPENLRELFQKKLHSKVSANKNHYSIFKDFKIIRSSELIYFASKKNLLNLKDPRALEAMLYGVKYHGCAISEKEIKEMQER